MTSRHPDLLTEEQWKRTLNEAQVRSDPARAMAGRNLLRADRAALLRDVETLRALLGRALPRLDVLVNHSTECLIAVTGANQEMDATTCICGLCNDLADIRAALGEAP